MTEWTYLNNPEIKQEDLDISKAIVYKITNILNGKVYFGKKRLTFYRSKPIKDSRYKRRVVKESDWREYWGSSEELAKDIVKFGKENFKREILRFCKSTSESSYFELKFQMDYDVLLHPAKYYNSFVGCKIHRKHVLGKF